MGFSRIRITKGSRIHQEVAYILVEEDVDGEALRLVTSVNTHGEPIRALSIM